ncbi:MAG: zinc-dependent metalloprotease, partial [Actinomycetales bacterium]|nr:zinc-dependent metalloprotease [Actinomycetales bacterium]
GTVLVPANVDAYAEGQSVPPEEVRLFLALREAAHARLYAHVTWLRAHVLALVHDYARGVTIDLSSLEESLRSVDLSDPQALQQAITSDVFAPQVTPAQESALLRLETVLALVEGWVDEVVAAAATAHLPQTVALREMVRRRRAAGGPGETAFANLVGLELRPRRSREAAALFAHVQVAGGPEAREAVWAHPDLLPTAEDLDNPSGFLARREAARTADAEIDEALAALLELGEQERDSDS